MTPKRELRDAFLTMQWVEEVSQIKFPQTLAFGIAGIGSSPEKNWNMLKQVHGTTIVTLEDDLTSIVEGDGLFTTKPNLTLCVKTADCLPVVLYSPGLLFLLHCGWRSLAGGIVNKALAKAIQIVKPSELYAILGPAISPARYEVGPELIPHFASPELGLSEPQLGYCLTKSSKDRWYLDIASVAACIFLNADLPAQNISAVRSCTFDNPKQWHSFRRDREEYGRNYTWARLV